MAEMPVVVVRDADGNLITPELVVQAYWERCYPMADHRDGLIRWYRPATRAVITWDHWRIPRSLEKVLRNQRPYRYTRDQAFAQVIAACSVRETTWISADIERLYTALHQAGIAHSVEAWRGEDLVGGLYGLAIGGCFCGESMFHHADDAAKACVVHLVEHLQASGFQLLDCQQQTGHMERFGAREISDDDYASMLASARQECTFTSAR